MGRIIGRYGESEAAGCSPRKGRIGPGAMSRARKTKYLVMAAAFIAGFTAALLWLRQPMSPLTRESLAAARQRWRDAAVPAYSARYRMHGSEYAIEWRNGIVENALVNGRPPTTTALHAYTIDGLFDTLEEELDNLTDPGGPFAGRVGAVLMRARFNDRLGYVERYLRSSGGHGRGASIEMIEFARRE